MAKELTNEEIIELCNQCENTSLREKVNLIFEKYEGFPIHDGPIVKQEGKVYDISLRPKDGAEVAIIFNTAKELLLEETTNKFIKNYKERFTKCKSLKEKEGLIAEELEIISRDMQIDEYIALGYKSEKGKRMYSTRPLDLGNDRIFSYITGAAYYNYELFLLDESENHSTGELEELTPDLGVLNPTHRLRLIDELDIIDNLLKKYPQLENRKARIIGMVSLLCGYKKGTKDYLNFEAAMKKYLNGVGPATEKSYTIIKSILAQFDIEISPKGMKH